MSTVICMSVALALILQYHHLAKLSVYQIHCSSSKTQTSDEIPLPELPNISQNPRSNAKQPRQILAMLQDTPKVSNSTRRNSVD